MNEELLEILNKVIRDRNNKRLQSSLLYELQDNDIYVETTHSVSDQLHKQYLVISIKGKDYYAVFINKDDAINDKTKITKMEKINFEWLANAVYADKKCNGIIINPHTHCIKITKSVFDTMCERMRNY